MNINVWHETKKALRPQRTKDCSLAVPPLFRAYKIIHQPCPPMKNMKGLRSSTTLYADNGCGRRTLTRVAIDPYSISSPQLRGDFGKLVPAESHSA